MKKILLGALVLLGLSATFAMAEDYVYFYGNGCSHCAKVERFFEKNDVKLKFNIEEKEVYFDQDNREELLAYADKLGLDRAKVGVPFLIINDGEDCNYVNGDKDIIEMFDTMLASYDDVKCEKGDDCEHVSCSSENCKHLKCQEGNEETSILLNVDETHDEEKKEELGKRLSFFGVMLPAALADSINPCAFAVMLLLLTSILSKEKSRRKAIWAGLLFALAVFISYFAMGMGLFSALANASNTLVLKIVVGALGILVGLANLKDFFWYGKGFVMEVPFSWRPAMQKIIQKAVSPIGAFFMGLVVSMFLLPCTSGPYFTILGYLASESANLHFRGYVYLIVYNLIFVLPMVIIALMVGLGWKSAEDIAKAKNKHKKTIHLIVGLLMLGLGAYVLLTL